ncbi:hypothetical protein Tco_1178510 [Tanacetum coccineum]
MNCLLLITSRTRSGMTAKAIEELVNRQVEEALAAYEATRAANALEVESQSQNGSDDENGNSGNGNGGDGNGGKGNQMRIIGVLGLLLESVHTRISRSVNHSTLRERNELSGNVIAAEPTRLQDDIRIANNLMDQKLKGYAMKNTENKRKFDNSQKDNRGQQPPNKR